ncbi:uncharacterized protein BXZ73DRAFT_56407 [Epithele typhae]|uniref:uncharacterized protein n=1 Tax=Epithele typhae TaxID=378194 RepID=UPI0020075287|nr:uncharacterized protein BXZ73DRAFT_56407 [Epithele typhae]KAH9912246.1 hypothetical protein BXZ73DRAFT_56407 [Epithele typhae]
MSERGVGKPWTTLEDNLLVQAVAIHGENDNWKIISASVPGRTNKACRKRWLHSLSPNVKKSAWTAEEDQQLLSLFATHGQKWSVIARQIPGRTDDACSKRYREALDPSLKRDDWTADEDARLFEAHERHGGRWGLIGQELNRSGLGCRNRYRMLDRRRQLQPQIPGQAGPSHAVPGTLASALQGTSDGSGNQGSPFWDGRSPQYVAPSVLHSGSSPQHVLQPQGASFSPQQILSGAHLTPPHPSAQEVSQDALPSSSALDDAGRSTPAPVEPQGSFSPEHTASDLPAEDPVSPSNYDFLADDDDVPDHPSVCDQHSGRISPMDGTQSAVHASASDIDPSVTPGPTDVPAAKGHYRTEEEKEHMRTLLPKRRLPLVTRLSSKLPVTSDTSVLAYACGHRDCWPPNASQSANVFTTSGELAKHSRNDHNGDLGGVTPFRCGLEGCVKSWKSLNGLQYHLQISKYHFQDAIMTQEGDPVAPSNDRNNAPATNSTVTPTKTQPSVPPVQQELDEHGIPIGLVGPEIGRYIHNTFRCPHEGCTKKYKQKSGLKYHLVHGHNADEDRPVQLSVVPPALAKKVKEKQSNTHNNSRE